jgi:hypothetical protein
VVIIESRKKETTILTSVKYKGLIRDRPHVTIFCGRKGSGKTQLLVKLLRDKEGYRHVYDEVLIVSPTFRLQDVWNRVSPEGITVYEAFSEEILEKIYTEQKPHVKSLLILDDNGEDLRRINQQVFNKLISNSRHLNLSVICLLQKLTQAPTILRSNTDCFAVFAACSTREQDVLFAEIGVLEKGKFKQMFSDATCDRYSCLVVSMQDGKLRFYKNFESEYIIK